MTKYVIWENSSRQSKRNGKMKKQHVKNMRKLHQNNMMNDLRFYVIGSSTHI